MKASKFLFIFLIISFAIFLFYNAIFPYSAPNWIGFREDDNLKIKTLWDWLDLLIVPATIGLIGWIYKDYEKLREEKRQKEINSNETLNNYFKNISDLILRNDLLENKNESKMLARTLTIVVLENLDGSRKGQILQFLKELKLLQIIDILGANFSNCDVEGIVFKNEKISGVNFKKSDFKNTYLDGTSLISCNLEFCNFSNSSLKNVDFNYSNLKNAIIRNVDLSSVNFYGAELENADLRDSIITKEQYQNLSKLNKGIKLTTIN